ncbi:uncharacterized protein [Triticum aestivum]|uniref:uncharacterized protein n=1 Tax=Triticum aestivum TaxID=4565 RepID=UPI001D018802|nr:uncharacterized protein LOC123045059 [Triticum aestivum]
MLTTILFHDPFNAVDAHTGSQFSKIDGFAAVVGRNIIDGRGKAGRLRRAPTPSGRPTKAAMQLRLVPLSPSLCSCQTQRKVEAEEEAGKRSCKRKLLKWKKVNL